MAEEHDRTDAAASRNLATIRGVAHDFNNLLGVMIGTSDAILARPDLDPAVAADMRRLRADALRGSSLVRQIIVPEGDAHPGEANGGAAGPGLALDAALAGMLCLLRRLCGPAIEIVTHLHAPRALLRLVPAQLDQLVMNLATNARDAMPDGGVLALRTMAGDGRATIEICDTGPGIPPALLPRLFAEGVSTRPGPGRGIGLATIRRILRAEGGDVAVRGGAGRGTRFVITLPCDLLPEPNGDRAVLFVDDEPGMLRMAQRLFAAADWQVLTACCANEAIEMAQAHARQARPVSLLVTDYQLPDMDGVTLVRHLRRERPGLPAIVTSGHDARHMRRVGARAMFLPKPYRFDHLLTVSARAVAAPPPLPPSRRR